jgi:hypothetical protein
VTVSNDAKFIEGLIVKAPHANAPEYVKAKLSIKRMELIAWLTQQDGEWINADVKVSQNGKWYCQIDDWKPNAQRGGGPVPQRGEQPKPGRRAPPANTLDDGGDEIPFISQRGRF